MSERASSIAVTSVVFAALTLFWTLGGGTRSGRAAPLETRSDIVFMENVAAHGEQQMPTVAFSHDRHTQSLGEAECTTCHLEEKGALVPEFKRTKAQPADMDLYHENCVACHVTTRAGDKPSGPIASQCRSCHDRRPTATVLHESMAFDRSLHYLHERSPLIKQDADNTNCSACHHGYENGKKTEFSVRGKEASCRYCHEASGTDKAPSMADVSHESCVGCHQTFVGTGEDFGPVTCEGCHGLDAKSGIKTVETPPRLDRGQPDHALVTRGRRDLAVAGMDASTQKISMDSVPFDHKLHESTSESCLSCHHKSLESCQTCHTEKGDDRGGNVRLSEAMHKRKSDRSCIGCHNQRQKAPECAGCHAQRPDTAFADNACNTCHKPAAGTGMPAPSHRTQFNGEVPKTVVIDSLEEKYNPSILPHAKIIKALEEKIEESPMAKAFHKDEFSLCQGCHHNAPSSERPQKCGSCHATLDLAGDGRPGLKGAFHGQCITCHDKMNMASIPATDCSRCHKEKQLENEVQ